MDRALLLFVQGAKVGDKVEAILWLLNKHGWGYPVSRSIHLLKNASSNGLFNDSESLLFHGQRRWSGHQHMGGLDFDVGMEVDVHRRVGHRREGATMIKDISKSLKKRGHVLESRRDRRRQGR